jgi:D-arabinose 1-dehydrogenase-like Zn-dependent alcohol dehydrogenase
MDLMPAGAISPQIVLTRFEDVQSSLERLERGELEERLVVQFMQ